MISAILTGRNDDYGGGFGHRAALSINMLAEQLDDADEIIFIDWNTAEGSSTLPQAVAGSLTRRARALLRTLRVCGDIHAEYVRRGAFAAIVPVVAYNAAIRRANPSNRWILITTPDMLLISRHTGRTLSAVAAGLPDGVYGLPRFELPRWIWRGLDPCNPSATAARLSTCGKRLHLEEAVRLPLPVLFDAPGDFQLVLRADLVAIDGLDEGMLGALGSDSNLLKRLALTGRRIVDLEQHFAAYHCDHTSLSSSSHRVGRMENDMRFFFEEVERPDLPFQRSMWGLADRNLPEVTLSEDVQPAAAELEIAAVDPEHAALLEARFAAIATAIGSGQSGFYDTTPLFNRAGYPARHVITFLLDHVFDSAGPIYYVGVNELLMLLLTAILKRLEPHRSLACIRPEDRAGFEQCHGRICRADARPLFIFDFGIDAGETAANPSIQECGEAVRRLLWEVRDRFVWCVERERQPGRSEGCAIRIATVNAINTEFEQLVLTSLDCGLSSFVTRTRSGPVGPEPLVPVVSHPAAAHMAARLGRQRGVHVNEFARTWAIARRLAREQPVGRIPSPWLVRSVDALLDWPGAAAAFDVANQWIGEIRSRIMVAREALTPMTRQRIGNDTVAASKLASVNDWEIPEWYEFARWYLGDHRSYNVFQRHRRDWEHIHLLFCLCRFGILDTRAEVAVLVHTPNRFANMLARRVGKVHLINIGWKSNDRFFRVPELRLDSSIQIYKGLSDPAFRDVGVSVLIAQNHNSRPFGAFNLRSACRALAADGLLGVSFDVCVRAAKGWGLDQWRRPLPQVDDIESDNVRRLAVLPHEFKPIPSVDWSVDPESFELVAPSADWRWRQMTAEKHGQRITSAIRWFRRGDGEFAAARFAPLATNPDNPHERSRLRSFHNPCVALSRGLDAPDGFA